MEGGNSVMNQHFQQMAAFRAEREKAHEEGVPALKRLFAIAQGNSGQCKSVARFLLALYNGYRFPLDLRELRGIDAPIFPDCIAVLKMDSSPKREVHCYFENGSAIFEQLAADWDIENMALVREQAKK
ncbi:MAG: hypothetical protein NT086_08870 [Proteobacteria bacterium]|nr:hypothetical protein [Pseudomonadota bacterium]